MKKSAVSENMMKVGRDSTLITKIKILLQSRVEENPNIALQRYFFFFEMMENKI
jgi:hypothetical protein